MLCRKQHRLQLCAAKSSQWCPGEGAAIGANRSEVLRFLILGQAHEGCETFTSSKGLPKPFYPTTQFTLFTETDLLQFKASQNGTSSTIAKITYVEKLFARMQPWVRWPRDSSCEPTPSVGGERLSSNNSSKSQCLQTPAEICQTPGDTSDEVVWSVPLTRI